MTGMGRKRSLAEVVGKVSGHLYDRPDVRHLKVASDYADASQQENQGRAAERKPLHIRDTHFDRFSQVCWVPPVTPGPKLLRTRTTAMGGKRSLAVEE